MTAPLRRLDGYLSRRAQLHWPGALVWIEPDDTYVLERPDHPPIGLGQGSGLAGLTALTRAEGVRRRGAGD